jgi:hypothetical protein
MVPLWAAIIACGATGVIAAAVMAWLWGRTTARAEQLAHQRDTEQGGAHRYTSTYCIHGLCDLPGVRGPCRRHCKTCAAACRCPCHAIETDPQPERNPR